MIFVPPVAVIAIHQASLNLFGGRPGIRDEGMLQSALARPENKLAYAFKGKDPSDETDPDLRKVVLSTLAAAYAFGLAKNHPFNDGNKRVALATTVAFLRLNGHQLVAPDPVRVFEMEALASSEHTEEDFAGFIRSNICPAP